MKAFSLSRALTLGCLLCLSLPLACGDDDDDNVGAAGKGGSSSTAGAAGKGGASTAGTAGTGGRATQPTAGDGAGGGGGAGLPPGLSEEPSTKMCGAETCESSQAALVYYVDPCCAANDACGLDTTFLSLVGAKFTDTCQAHDQPGTDEGSCPDATGLTVPYNGSDIDVDSFPGCCRPDGTCGVEVNEVTSNGFLPIASLGLGCVEAAPFFGGRVRRCDDMGVGGAGGAGSTDGGGQGGASP